MAAAGLKDATACKCMSTCELKNRIAPTEVTNQNRAFLNMALIFIVIGLPYDENLEYRNVLKLTNRCLCYLNLFDSFLPPEGRINIIGYSIRDGSYTGKYFQ